MKQADLDKLFLTGPGEDLVPKLIDQMAKIPGFVKIFGPPGDKTTSKWADYPRHDWSLRMLPCINIFENQPETKESDNAFLNGNIVFQIYWPANFRRPDSRRIEVAFKGAMENFFASSYVQSMLDELYWIQRPEKVYGLNALGKMLTWTPNNEGIIESEMVPVTIFEVSYRIDLRAWYRAMEFMNRTKDEPFKETLSDLLMIGGLDSVYQGLDNNEEVQIEISS